MRKVLFHVATGLCILVSAGLIGLWVRSYYRTDRFRWVSWHDEDGGTTVHVTGLSATRGQIYFLHERSVPATDPTQKTALTVYAQRTRYRILDYNDDSILASLGLVMKVRHFSEEDLLDVRYIAGTPYWFLLLLTGGYPLGTYIRKVVRRQEGEHISPQTCPRCGEPIPPHSTHCSTCDRPVSAAVDL